MCKDGAPGKYNCLHVDLSETGWRFLEKKFESEWKDSMVGDTALKPDESIIVKKGVKVPEATLVGKQCSYNNETLMPDVDLIQLEQQLHWHLHTAFVQSNTPVISDALLSGIDPIE